MNLFTPVVEPEKFHKNFASVLVSFREAERRLLEKWADGFVDRDGKFVKEFQITFNSSFWEIYLYALFKKYNITVDWSYPTPDFYLSSNRCEFIVEAVTANSSHGKPNEWDKAFSREELEKLGRLKELNTEAIIRLSNAIIAKVRKYNESYKKLKHVAGKPFILAIAPFEQPHFNIQHDRPIRALLFDHYVDEDAYLDNPGAFPNGPPSVNLEYVTKENGAEIPLGLFKNDSLSEVSAIIFSCLATWGKLSAMSNNPATNTIVSSLWATPPRGAPEMRSCSPSEHGETILDGLQIYHNPFASNPLPPEVFRAHRVVQHYVNNKTGEWLYEGNTQALLFRQVHATPKMK
ncbi:hypothetical protein [Aeromonas veronii]|uniref:hypothetical protein n=1 Tax=Aeromonas veronii TaxID=654 RepID=UPI003BA2AF54